MDAIERTREALTGCEFDWLLRDATGHLALCETAGCGDVPDALLALGVERLRRDEETIAAILSADLPEATCREEWRGVGIDRETLGYGRRGLYVFDWKPWSGPYRRIVVPDRPVHADAFAPLLGDLLDRAPTVPFTFAGRRSFRLAD